MEFSSDAFNDNISSLGNSNNKNLIEINSKLAPNLFYLNIYNKVIFYLFWLKNLIFFQKILKINQKIIMNNIKIEKPKTNYLILLKTITKIMSLYKQAKLDKDRVTINVLIEIW